MRGTSESAKSREIQRGEVTEWTMVHAWNACVPKRYRGFESHPLRFFAQQPFIWHRARESAIERPARRPETGRDDSQVPRKSASRTPSGPEGSSGTDCPSVPRGNLAIVPARSRLPTAQRRVCRRIRSLAREWKSVAGLRQITGAPGRAAPLVLPCRFLLRTQVISYCRCTVFHLREIPS